MCVRAGRKQPFDQPIERSKNIVCVLGTNGQMNGLVYTRNKIEHNNDTHTLTHMWMYARTQNKTNAQPHTSMQQKTRIQQTRTQTNTQPNTSAHMFQQMEN